MKTFLSAVLQRLRTSYWFIPSLLALGATALSFATVHADTLINKKWVHATGWIWAGGPEGARNVLATIAGSTILREHARKIRDDGCAQAKNQSDRAEIEERFAITERALAGGDE